jgi:hypothetical protein
MTTIQDKRNFYCLDCFAYTEDTIMKYDPVIGCPVVNHNGRIDGPHRVIFDADIQLLKELGTSLRGQVARYELAEMYHISTETLEHVLSKLDGAI